MDLLSDNRFKTVALRDENREELLRVLEPVFQARTTGEWLDALSGAGIPCAPINTIAAALADPQTEARQCVEETWHPVLGRVRHITSPIRVGGARTTVARGPFFGEHTSAVLQEVCGYTADEIDDLNRRGVIRERGTNGSA